MSIAITSQTRSFKKVLLIGIAAAALLAVAGFIAMQATNESVNAAQPADYSLKGGDRITAHAAVGDPDIYVVGEANHLQAFKRNFKSVTICNFYGQFGPGGCFAPGLKQVPASTRDAFPTSCYYTNGDTDDKKVWYMESTGADTGTLHHVQVSGAEAVAGDPLFFMKLFRINNLEANYYAIGAPYTSMSQVPACSTGEGQTQTPTPPSGPISVSLSAGNPGAQTITKNAVGVEMLRARFSGNGTVNTVTVKRLGPGATADFSNIYVYDGATRLTSGKSFSSSSGEATFLLNVGVSGIKELSILADMAGGAATAGNVNYVQLVSATVTGGAAVSGTPLNGNNFALSGASSGTLDVAKVGSISNPTVGQKQAQLSEFKLTANTEGASVKRLTLLNGGTLKPSDLTNLKLTTGTMTWNGSVTTDSYIVFDLGAGYTIAKGANATFKVWGDVGGKKDETVDLYFENDSDILSVGDQYGQGMAEGTNTLDTAAEADTLTLQGGALTLVYNGPGASTVGTSVTDVTLLRYSITAASNIEIKKTELTLCADQAGDGTYDTETTEGDWDDVTDVKVWNEATNSVVIGPKDGTAFDHADGDCGATGSGVQESFTDTLDLAAGVTYNFKVTADIDTSLVAGELIAGSIIKVVLDDYSDDAGDVTVMKYSGTNTAVAAADIVPRADISGSDITLSASSLTLSLSGTPADQTTIRGTQNVDTVGITFAAGQASALKVTTIKITGYAAETAGGTYDEGVAPSEDTGISVANAVSSVELYEAGSGALVAGSNKVTSNLLGTAGTGTMTFSNLTWDIPAGTSKTLLIRVDLSNNTASGSAGDGYAFDIGAVGDVTALDSDSDTVNAGNAKVNGTVAAPTQVVTVKNSGSMTLATSADTPSKGAIYWGQVGAPVSTFRLSATDEGQYIEKLTIAASASGELTDAAANVKEVVLTYKNKAGSSVTVTQSFGNAASVNFAWASTDANRPYVPQDSSMDLAVKANMKTKAEGATQTNASPQEVFFSLDLVDSFNGSYVNGFRAVGAGSGTVIDGTGTNIADVLGGNNQYVYRVFPKLELVPLAGPYNLIGTPTVFKFSITAMGLADSTLRFDNEAAGSGSIKFEILSSGSTDGDTSVTTYDDSNSEIIDTLTLTDDGNAGTDASYSMDFTSKDIEIAGGTTKTFRIQLNSTTVYDDAATPGTSADYFQVVLRDTSADDTALVNWVANYDGTTNSVDQASVAGVLRSVPLFGPTFTRN
ncbi:MAG: hypothetical protein AAB483_01355 [Patescibacteria group bacterium]